MHLLKEYSVCFFKAGHLVPLILEYVEPGGKVWKDTSVYYLCDNRENLTDDLLGGT